MLISKIKYMGVDIYFSLTNMSNGNNVSADSEKFEQAVAKSTNYVVRCKAEMANKKLLSIVQSVGGDFYTRPVFGGAI